MQCQVEWNTWDGSIGRLEKALSILGHPFWGTGKTARPSHYAQVTGGTQVDPSQQHMDETTGKTKSLPDHHHHHRSWGIHFKPLNNNKITTHLFFLGMFPVFSLGVGSTATRWSRYLRKALQKFRVPDCLIDANHICSYYTNANHMCSYWNIYI